MRDVERVIALAGGEREAIAMLLERNATLARHLTITKLATSAGFSRGKIVQAPIECRPVRPELPDAHDI